MPFFYKFVHDRALWYYTADASIMFHRAITKHVKLMYCCARTLNCKWSALFGRASTIIDNLWYNVLYYSDA